MHSKVEEMPVPNPEGHTHMNSLSRLGTSRMQFPKPGKTKTQKLSHPLAKSNQILDYALITHIWTHIVYTLVDTVGL